ALLALRPFPTRRSSDLVTGFDAGVIRDTSFGYGLPNETPIRGQVTAVCRDRGWWAQAIYNGTDTYICWGRDLGPGEASVGSSPIDRKSTRLNSSHEWIS